jgi:signal transduction histidine kinase
MYDPTLLIVFFVYGLAFFSLGLTLALEIGRSPSSAEVRVLWPLAIFGGLHGIHEWFESYLMQAQAAGTLLPGWLPWLRISLLVSSFLSLVVYGIWSFQQPGYRPLLGMRPALVLIGIYLAGILTSAFLAYRSAPIPWVDFLDVISRYILAAPGAIFATLAFRFSARRAAEAGKVRLANALRVSMTGFFVYGLVQFVAHPLQMFPANFLNADVFRSTFGFPVQIIRALAAVVITLGVLRVTQLIELEREEQLNAAQRERLEALERVQEELTKREPLRRELLRHIVQAQEDERARIARELHDETAQTLAAFSLDLATMQAIVTDKPEYQQLNVRLKSLSKQMSQSLYRLVHDLRPAQLDDLGLASALQYLADQDASSRGLEVELKIEGVARRLDKTVETVLFRVAQEALTNVARHAGTSQARILLSYANQEVRIAISDAGVGFDSQQSFEPPRGWGLMGMRERLEAVGGQLTIRSGAGQGTEVSAVISVFDKIP